MTVVARQQIDVETRNPERRGLRKGVYLIPSVFTAANIGMGFYAVMAAVRGFQFVGNGIYAEASVYLDNAAKAIGWAVLFDMLDGRIARMAKTTTEIGVQLDSIADVVTFGLAPAVLAYVWGYGSSVSTCKRPDRGCWQKERPRSIRNTLWGCPFRSPVD